MAANLDNILIQLPLVHAFLSNVLLSNSVESSVIGQELGMIF